ncbi:MAG: hypothetical protein RLY49_30 [Candidatus Parcubacteria bacterium]|jgi:hypothetical protein
MLKEFLLKKENIFMFFVILISLFCIVFGFLFLFFGNNKDSDRRIIPNSVTDIKWANFNSDILDKKIQYPEYMDISEQKENQGVGVTIAEFKPKEFLTYFSNQNHISIYPEGLDNQLFYGKTRQGEYTSSTGQSFTKIEYLTTENFVWGVALIPKETPKKWSKNGFIWIQSTLKNKEDLCISKNGILINNVICDPYSDQLPVYKGNLQEQFIRFGYKMINKNTF